MDIHKIFEKMDFADEVLLDLNKAKEWLRDELPKINKYRFSASKSLDILNMNNPMECFGTVYTAYFFSGKGFDFSDDELSKKMNQVADRIAQNEQLIIQIENLTRGIAAKDTIENLKLMINCFRQPVNIWNGNQNSLRLSMNDSLMILGQKIAISMYERCKELHLSFCEPSHLRFPVVLILLLKIMDDIGLSTYVTTVESDPLKSIKSSLVIFDDSDINSACEMIPSAAWQHHGSLPWSLNTLLVQESIYEVFVEKLKEKLSKLRFGLPNNKQVDIHYLPTDIMDYKDTKEIINISKEKGFDCHSINRDFPANLIFGRKNQITESNSLDLNLYISSFRTLNEAVSLVHNTKLPIMAVSVWTENIGITNEISRKLRINNIWFNSFGLFSSNLHLELLDVQEQDKSIEIKIAEEAQKKWLATPDTDKKKIFQQVVECCERNQKDDVIQFLKEYENCKNLHKLDFQGDYQVISIQIPRNVVILPWPTLQCILMAVFENNSVIFSTVNDDDSNTIKELTNIFPKNLITCSDEYAGRRHLPKDKSTVIYDTNITLPHNKQLVTFTKNIWQPITHTYK